MKNGRTICHGFDPPDELRRSLKQWAILWGISDLPECVHIEYSARLRRSLGRCFPQRKLVRLNSVLALKKNRSLLTETLCHEAAHLAVFLLHGPGTRPHGQEWRAFVRLAGLEPRTRVPEQEIHELPNKRQQATYSYIHRCANCQTAYKARRTDRRWRCARCRDAGRDGRFEVTRRKTSDRRWVSL